MKVHARCVGRPLSNWNEWKAKCLLDCPDVSNCFTFFEGKRYAEQVMSSLPAPPTFVDMLGDEVRKSIECRLPRLD